MVKLAWINPIYDVLEAGFKQEVFMIRKDFDEIIGQRMKKKVKVEYMFQKFDS